MSGTRASTARVERLVTNAFVVGRSAAALLLTAVPSERVHAQSLRLANQQAAGEQFTMVKSVAELSGNRLLVADAGDNRLAIYQWDGESLTDVGRRGRGPGEYQSLGRLFSFGGDSVLVEDAGLRQWSVFDGIRLGGAINIRVRAAGMVRLAGGSHDRSFLEIRPGLDGRFTDGRRTNVLMLASTLEAFVGRAGGDQLNPAGTFKGGFAGDTTVLRPVTPNGSPISWSLTSLLTAEDQLILLPDGTIVYARQNPLRVTFRDRSGRTIADVLIPYTYTADTDEEKQFAFKRVHTAAQQRTLRFQDFPGWPSVVPPIDNDGLLAGPEGSVIMLLRPTARKSQVAMYVRRTGVVETIALPAGHRLVGAGFRSIYTVQKNPDDLEQLYRWSVISNRP
jgi:hypothetical protein